VVGKVNEGVKKGAKTFQLHEDAPSNFRPAEFAKRDKRQNPKRKFGKGAKESKGEKTLKNPPFMPSKQGARRLAQEGNPRQTDKQGGDQASSGRGENKTD